jgi:hypothetical protein
MQREDLIQALSNRTRKIERPRIEAAVDYFLDPNVATTLAGIARAANISRPTARRWRNILIKCIETTPQEVGRSTETHPRPSDAALDQVRLAARAEGDQTKRTLETGELTGADLLKIIDKTIRRLDDEKAPGNALKSMLDLKIKYQALEAQRAENIQDPQKVLGPDGLVGLTPTLISRFNKLLAHRREIPQFYHAAGTLLLRALAEDLPLADAPADLNEALSRISLSVSALDQSPGEEEPNG